MADSPTAHGLSWSERLYLLGRGRPATPAQDDAPESQPADAPPVLWLHAEGQSRLRRIAALSEQVLQHDRAGPVLLTHGAELPAPPEIPGRVTMALDSADPKACADILARFRPAVLLLAADRLLPALISLAGGASVPVMLAEIDKPQLGGSAARLPGLRRALLRHCSTVFLTGDADKAQWHAAGLRNPPVDLPGRLRDVPATLGCNEAEREALATACRQRTIWLAAAVPETEEALVIAAHRAALRESLRVILILHPLDPMRGPALKSALQGRFNVALRSVDNPITPETQVYIADTEGERGLWLRMATTCYIGGSLGGLGAQINPLEAVALGCAVVHGHAHGPHDDVFRQLQKAGATKRVARAELLGRAVCELLAPDVAARMAHAGWDVIAEGAGAANAMIEALLKAADARRGVA